MRASSLKIKRKWTERYAQQILPSRQLHFRPEKDKQSDMREQIRGQMQCRLHHLINKCENNASELGNLWIVINRWNCINGFKRSECTRAQNRNAIFRCYVGVSWLTHVLLCVCVWVDTLAAISIRILYNIYDTLLQLKLEIGNVQPIKKFFIRRFILPSLHGWGGGKNRLWQEIYNNFRWKDTDKQTTETDVCS